MSHSICVHSARILKLLEHLLILINRLVKFMMKQKKNIINAEQNIQLIELSTTFWLIWCYKEAYQLIPYYTLSMILKIFLT